MTRTDRFDFLEIRRCSGKISSVGKLYCQHCKHLIGQNKKSALQMVNFHFDSYEADDFETFFKEFI